MPFRKRPFSFCHFLCRHIFYGYAELPGGVDLTLHTAGHRIAENPQLVTVSQRLFTHIETEPSVVGVMLKNFSKLRFSPSMEALTIAEKRINPKRMQREINKQLQNTGGGTKAQQALKLQQEEGKMERKSRSREQREAEKDRQFQLQQEKRKEKHRGH